MKLISWGANSHGQLGQGHKSEQCSQPQNVRIDESLNLKPGNILSVCGGAEHTLVLDKNGQVFGCGGNNRGQLGIEEKESLEIVPLLSLTNEKCLQIACGWEFSAAVTENGDLYVWGSNSHNQLGISKTDYKAISKPFHIRNIRVKYVSCGLRHMALINEDGNLIVCGSGNSGQLGITSESGKELIETKFTEIPNLTNIKLVACGQKFTVAVNEDNDIYVWGDNKWGQLALDPQRFPKIKVPLKLNLDFNKIIGLYCGWSHTCILTENNEIWTWGRNSYGQLGRISETNWKPGKVDLSDVLCVRAASEHNIAITRNGQLFTWGWNEHGNCGTGNEVDVHEPFLINFNEQTRALCIGSGTGQSFAVFK